MSSLFLDTRRAGLEEAFFAQQNEMLRRKLVDEAARRDARQALAATAGTHDDALLDRLGALGLSSDTVAALTLVPLVLIAWADGVIPDLERQAVMDAAHEHGVLRGSPASTLLESWLRTPPPASLAETWKAYVTALATPLDLDARKALEHSVMDQAKKVADSTGGLLGITSRVSTAEREKLSELSAAFHPVS
ncbi:hypothetical protein [Roseococcus sp. YIM B11640]|uniref:hypothetical protein n=1 Tax=Roseococcus sp. YIM B11640 TaxID=3133973 RepID=UPI003C7B7E5F